MLSMLLADPGFDPMLVENALQDILASQYFRSSAQCSSLLRYVVQNTLADRDECLRERVIGSEVFDRAPDYDTGNDHIVRSRASEVRKRLAQYYQSSSVIAEVRISVPSGSYRAAFERGHRPANGSVSHEPDHAVGLPIAVPHESVSTLDARLTSGTERQLDEEITAEPTPSKLPRRWLALSSRQLIAVCAVFAMFATLGLFGRLWLTPQTSAFDKFWAPLNKSSKPALIYCGGGFVYKLSDQFLDEYRLKHGQRDTRREFFVDLKPGETVPSQDLIPDRHFVPFGDLASAARVVTTLSGFKKPYDLRYGDDLAFTEFHTSPVVLIGGLNNSWALQMMHTLRFALEQDDRIVDQWHREKVWTQRADPDNQARDDYAIISRLNSSDNATGGFVLSIAGIRMYGTRAAADLISDPARLNEALKDLPRGWEMRNLQVVLHTRTMNEIPISANVEAIHSW